MKNLMRYGLAIMLIVGLTITMAHAKDVSLNVKITDMVEKVDKNGNPYIRFIAEVTRTLEGITYQTGVPIMAFGSAVEKARTYKVGDNLKCIAKYKEFGSRDSYTILTFL